MGQINLKKSDFHAHSLGSSDAKYSVDAMLRKAKRNNLEYLAIADHNNLAYVKDFMIRNNFSAFDPYYECGEGLRLVPAVEVSCKINEQDSVDRKGNPLKVHLLVYSPLMTNNIFTKMIKYKHLNDISFDFGALIQLAELKNIDLDESDVRLFVERKRDMIAGFGTMYSEDCYEFFNKYYHGAFKSKREFANTYSKLKLASRFNLDVKDVIALAQSVGGICIMAHPQINLDRTPNPENCLDYLIEYGIDGFEVVSPSTRKEGYELIKRICKRHKDEKSFLKTAGSDFHRVVDWRDLGRFFNYDKNETTYISGNGVKPFIRELSNLKLARDCGEITHRNLPQIDLNYYDEKLDKMHRFVLSNKFTHGRFPIYEKIIADGIPRFEKEIDR